MGWDNKFGAIADGVQSSWQFLNNRLHEKDNVNVDKEQRNAWTLAPNSKQ